MSCVAVFQSAKSVTIFIEIAYKRCKTRFIQFKKMNKMERQTGGQWDDLLQSVVLAMNSSLEKSTDQTPFKLMGVESLDIQISSHV